MIKNFRNYGFTLIELILYISIVTIILTAVIPLSWNIIEGGAKSSTQQEVYSNARFIAETIKYEIRRASGITSVSSESISLANFSPDTSTTIDLSGGKIRINKNAAGAVNLNSNDTNVTSLVFTNYSSADNKTKNIGFTFTVAANYNSQKQEYNEIVNLRTGAEIRSN